MPSQKAQKIDLNAQYPCPCPRRRGHLLPIVLTEAFGCDRCQQIFVVEDNGYAIEQLSTSYPYKKAWWWTGSRWLTTNSAFRESYLPASLGIVLVETILVLTIAPRLFGDSHLARDPKFIIPFVIVLLTFALLPALWQWIAYRR